MNRGFIRVLWGIHQRDRWHRHRTYIESNFHYLKLNKYEGPFTAFVFGEDNYKQLVDMGYNCELVDKNPCVWDMEKEQFRHKIEALKLGMQKFDEMVFLDWDTQLIKPLPVDFWEKLKFKSSLQVSLRKYFRDRITWRKEDANIVPTAAFIYIRDKKIPDRLIEIWEELNRPWTEEMVLMKYIDEIMGGWKGLEEYWNNFEPNFFNLIGCSAFQEDLLKTKNICFSHISSRKMRHDLKKIGISVPIFANKDNIDLKAELEARCKRREERRKRRKERGWRMNNKIENGVDTKEVNSKPVIQPMANNIKEKRKIKNRLLREEKVNDIVKIDISKYFNPEMISKYDLVAEEILKIKHSNTYRDSFFPMMIDKLNFKVGVEVGVDKGGFSDRILERSKIEKYYCIDTWQDYFGSDYRKEFFNPDGNVRFNEARQTLSKYGSRVVFMRMSSLEASTNIEDESVDFCYIDGDHSLEGIYSDIKAWIPKVKIGGIICGHDYKDGPKSGISDFVGQQLDYKIKTVVDYYYQSKIWS